MMTDTRAAADMTKGVSLIGRHGLKADPTWAHVAYSIGGRDYLWWPRLLGYRDRLLPRRSDRGLDAARATL